MASAAAPTCVVPPTKDVRTDTLASFIPDCGFLFGTDEYYAATYEITTPPQHGTARVARDIATTLRYLPAAGYNGADSFSYRAVTPGGVSAPVTQSVSVSASANALPVCAPGAPGRKVRAGVARGFTLACTDADGDPLTIEITQAPGHAALTSGAVTDTSKLVTVTPTAGYTGVDSLVYRASDGRGQSATQTVPWTVVAADVNTAPTCSPPMFPPTLNRDTPSGATLYCQDAEDDPVGLEVTSQAGHGVAQGGAPASISPQFPYLTATYTPFDGYTGPDAFTVRPRDAQGVLGAPVIITLSVTPPPAPLGPQCSSSSQVTVRAGATARRGLACWFTSPGGPEIITPPAHGTVEFTDDGYRYTPAPGYTGPDSFGYRVLSAGGSGPTVTQAIQVVADGNTAPGCGIAFPGRGFGYGAYDEPVVRMGTSAPIRVSCFDAEDDRVTIVADDPTHGAVLGFAPIGSLLPTEDPAATSVSAGTYLPDTGFAGFDTLRITGADGRGGASAAEAVVAVRPGTFNTAPRCDSLPVSSQVLVAGGESAYAERCSDREGDPVSLVVTPPEGIAVEPFTRDGDVLSTVLRPDPATRGWRTFELRARDDRGADLGPMGRSLRVVAPQETFDRDLGRGESLGAEADDLPTPARPVTVRLTTLNEGRAKIAVTSGAAPSGYSAFGLSFAITAPDAIPEAPLLLRFRFDASLLSGVALGDITVFRDGKAVSACTGQGATPNPCVASRIPLRGGDAEIVVRTVRASTWSFGRAATPTPGTPPVDLPFAPGPSGDNVGGSSPQPQPQPTPPTLTLGALPKLRAALAKGFQVKLTSTYAGTARAKLTLDGKTAKRLKLSKGKPVAVATGTTSAAAGRPTTITLRFTKAAKRALAKAKKVTFTLQAGVNDGPVTTKTLTLKR